MQEQEQVDFLVVGSGAAALSAAIRAHDLGLKVLVIEKTDLYGGNSAMSGGVCWVPNNPSMRAAGLADSDEDGLLYLKSITRGEVPEEFLRTYISESQRMLEYFSKHGDLRYVALEEYTDYYPEAAGGRAGGRSMDPVPFDGSRLRENLLLLRRPHPQSQILGKFGITARQAHAALGLGIGTMLFMAWQMFLYFLRFPQRWRWGRDTKLTAGNAMMGRLLYSALKRGIALRRNTSLRDLMVEKGRVTGAIVEHENQQIKIAVRAGIMLGAGDFARNQRMRDEYQQAPSRTEWTAGSPANTGDAIVLGQKIGAQTKLMNEAWWTPVCLVPKSPMAWVLVVEKSLPHGLFVNQLGERFTNEAGPYIDVVHGMYADAIRHGPSNARWYHVFDATYRETSISGPIAPGRVMPDRRLPRRYREEFLTSASSLHELAQKMNLPVENLLRTIERFNDNARIGEDPDFHRGKSAQDRYYGNPKVKPNCALGPISKPPFYAVQIYPGDLGTKGGLVTDVCGRVIHRSGAPIPGLFAAGNSSASIMGRTYPGAGGTIGPALTFGMIAAESAAHELQSKKNS